MAVCPKSLARVEALAAAEVARRLAARELSLSGLARRCGLSQPHLSNWIGGRRRLAVSAVDVVLAVLRVSPCELLGCAVCPCAAVALPAAGPADPPIRRAPWRRRVDPVDGAAA